MGGNSNIIRNLFMARHHMNNHIVSNLNYYEFSEPAKYAHWAKEWRFRFALPIISRAKTDKEWKVRNWEKILRIFSIIAKQYRDEADLTTKQCCICNDTIGHISGDDWTRRSKRFILGVCHNCEKEKFPYTINQKI